MVEAVVEAVVLVSARRSAAVDCMVEAVVLLKVRRSFWFWVARSASRVLARSSKACATCDKSRRSIPVM